ncbi:hypothetical protein E1292_43430 [Nonomuraea deserti]|uniref:Uncharacterized protein n=1 Tax=Nonomuraea deserti TaxID=1848322 RepID=A0A4R4UUY2_9ACTN|nr:hypothetical protein [Nonomuraea deserti]TDC90669.1 hypothetical protein E1292_43430 [Nonomuraea deserti]
MDTSGLTRVDGRDGVDKVPAADVSPGLSARRALGQLFMVHPEATGFGPRQMLGHAQRTETGRKHRIFGTTPG